MPEINWLLLENRIKATPLDLLRQGVKERSWEAVDVAYTMLTGEVPSRPIITTGDIKSSHLQQFNDTPIMNLADKKEMFPDDTPKRKRGRPKKNQLVIDTTSAEMVHFPNSSATAPSMPINCITVDPPTQVPNTYGVPTECIAPTKSSAKPVTERRSGGFVPHDMKPHINTWTDTRSEAANEIIPAEQRNIPSEVLNAQRPPVHNVKVKCTSCGRMQEVDPTLAPNGYRLTKKYAMQWKCNDCCVGARSGMSDENAIGDDDELFDDDTE